jgi:hypothetical protein
MPGCEGGVGQGSGCFSGEGPVDLGLAAVDRPFAGTNLQIIENKRKKN